MTRKQRYQMVKVLIHHVQHMVLMTLLITISETGWLREGHIR